MMNNMTVLIGKILSYHDKYFVMEVPSASKDSSGEITKHFFNVYISDNIKDNVIHYTKSGDLISVKGYLESEIYSDKSRIYRRIKIIGTKVAFLSSGSLNVTTEEDDEDEEDSYSSTSFTNAFKNCSSLKSIPDLSGLKGSKGDMNEES